MFGKKKNLFIVLILVCLNLMMAQTREALMGYHNQTFWGKEVVPHVILNRMMSDSSLVVWNTGKHTASPTPIGAIGPEKYTREFSGVIQNTKIAEVLKQAASEGVNIILVIGDGMGFNHMSLPIYYNVATGNSKKTYFEKIMNEGTSGILITNPYQEITTSSAAASTAMATGTKTRVGIVGLNHDGHKLKSTLDVAEEKGYATGLITDAMIYDATPAGFFGHSSYRYTEEQLTIQLVDDNEIEVLLGGGAAYLLPKGKKFSDYDEFKDVHPSVDGESFRKDDRNLIKDIKDKGYRLVHNKDELMSVKADTEKLFGVFATWGLNAAIDRDDEGTGEPSLVDMASKGLELLSKRDNYFVMIEAARIDWEAHDNDVGAVYKAVVEMNDVLAECYNQYKKDPENTLLVFTADHETGGLSLTYSSIPRKLRAPKTLESGDSYTRRKNSLDFANFLKMTRQTKSISRIFDQSKSAEELYRQLKKHVPYEVTKEEAEILFPLLKNYEKYK